MKTLREYIDQLDEISRRDALKYGGATAVGAALGTPKDAAADRQWITDPISGKWRAELQSETWPGAGMAWNDETNRLYLALQQPTNYSPNNVEKQRLHYPKITSPNYILRIGNNAPINGTGEIYSFPLRQLGKYTGYGINLIKDNPRAMSQIRDDFINADKIAVRLQIDGQPENIVFYENPELLRQRREQQQQSKTSPKIDELFRDPSFIETIKVASLLFAWGEPSAINEINRFMRIAGPTHGSVSAIKKEIERVEPLPAGKTINTQEAKLYIDRLKKVNDDLSNMQESLEETTEDPIAKIDRLFRNK